VPDAKMWVKIRAKYKGAPRIVLTWNAKTNSGHQKPWPWIVTEPPIWATYWTVVGMPKWHKFDGPEKESIDRRNYAESFMPRSRTHRGG